MKTVCDDCGAMLFTTDPETAKSILEQHKRMAHAPAMERELLAESREFLAEAAHANIPVSQRALELHNRISELLGLPAIDLAAILAEAISEEGESPAEQSEKKVSKKKG